MTQEHFEPETRHRRAGHTVFAVLVLAALAACAPSSSPRQNCDQGQCESGLTMWDAYGILADGICDRYLRCEVSPGIDKAECVEITMDGLCLPPSEIDCDSPATHSIEEYVACAVELANWDCDYEGPSTACGPIW